MKIRRKRLPRGRGPRQRQEEDKDRGETEAEEGPLWGDYLRHTFVAGMAHRNEKVSVPALAKACSSSGGTKT